MKAWLRFPSAAGRAAQAPPRLLLALVVAQSVGTLAVAGMAGRRALEARAAATPPHRDRPRAARSEAGRTTPVAEETPPAASLPPPAAADTAHAAAPLPSKSTPPPRSVESAAPPGATETEAWDDGELPDPGPPPPALRKAP